MDIETQKTTGGLIGVKRMGGRIHIFLFSRTGDLIDIQDWGSNKAKALDVIQRWEKEYSLLRNFTYRKRIPWAWIKEGDARVITESPSIFFIRGGCEQVMRDSKPYSEVSK